MLETDVAAMRARYPDAFRAHPVRRLKTAAFISIIIGIALFALWALDFSPQRIWQGLSRLGLFFSLLFPPDAHGRLPAFMKALGETLAIAFLGTLTAALVAFPVAFLAAKNVVPNIFVHFSLRRVFDVSRSVDTLIWALMWINVVGLGPSPVRSPSPVRTSAPSASCSRRPSKRRTASRWRACSPRAAAGSTACASRWCRRSCR